MADVQQAGVDNWGAGQAYNASRIPQGFDWNAYVQANPDLQQAGIDTPVEAMRHYSQYGYQENRPGNFVAAAQGAGAPTADAAQATTPTPTAQAATDPTAGTGTGATSVTQQIVSETPAIEAIKLDLLRQSRDLAYNVKRDAQGNVIGTTTPLSQQLPGYKVAGFSDAQEAAMKGAEARGLGAYSPYMTAANQSLGAGLGATVEAADYLRGADTRNQFVDAQQAMRNAALAGTGITSGIGQLGTGLGYLDLAGQRALMSDVTGRLGGAYQDVETGLGALATAQNMAALSSQAEMRPATAAIGQGLAGLTGAQELALGTAGADFAGSQALLGAGIGGYQPASQTAAFMNPYQQQVIDEAMRQINRQGQIAQQGLSAQAVRAGAFGGEREGVQRAELERGLLEQKSNTIATLLNQGYSQAQAQAMSAFEQQQQRRMQAGQTVGQQAAQQAQLGQAAAGLYGNLAQQQVAAGQGLGQLGVQQAQLGQSAAGLYNQAAQNYGSLASQTGALAGQEAGIQQNIANLLAAQAGQRGQVAQTAAGIYGQQANTFQNLGQGIGTLAGQQFGIGQSIASGLGALGGQLGQLGVQQAALGQTAQGMDQSDVNFLYNVGQARQAFNQQGLDAQRATALQQIYAPYQQLGFLSDIYRGAPSTQMSTQVTSQPTASPFQQAVGIGLAGLAGVTGAKKAGLF